MKRNILGRKPYSSHPDDDYLQVVLAKVETPHRQEFVTWVFNTQNNGYGHGHYFENLKEALADFNSRGNE